MINFIKNSIEKNGDKATIISIQCLHNLKKDIENLKNISSLNTYIRNVIDKYDFSLGKLNFDINSIITIASPSPFVKVTFTYNSKNIQLMMPPSYIDMKSKPVTLEKYLNSLLNPKGYRAKYTEALPQKFLAVRSGLGVYGRNNICYVEGMGSFHKIATYYSNVPCDKLDWYEPCQTNLCSSCNICIKKCPTKAITSENHLIKSERCLTHFNEHSGANFPEWIDPSSHNCIVGCIECQYSCPNNKNHLDNIVGPIEFTEEETFLLLNGKSIELFPDKLVEKVKISGMYDYLCVLPRNLKVLFEKYK